ncbi:hypothetical protein C498_07913 [Haloferax volcanii DS2]|uniref:Uncharacterized protein n=1 Tax=Haloferax volcanii (strain ATCC 29605 / DSM 3757 / JCM 8879 / NBRC 14742 / NCIMB 2012 / VKM B-1768 / DS2) TaxID=309800 RepID=L9V6L7_HALVD|nr:hypothetical protein C498_07913 [Haloferax volcanii DS2]
MPASDTSTCASDSVGLAALARWVAAAPTTIAHAVWAANGRSVSIRWVSTPPSANAAAASTSIACPVAFAPRRFAGSGSVTTTSPRKPTATPSSSTGPNRSSGSHSFAKPTVSIGTNPASTDATALGTLC